MFLVALSAVLTRVKELPICRQVCDWGTPAGAQGLPPALCMANDGGRAVPQSNKVLFNWQDALGIGGF